MGGGGLFLVHRWAISVQIIFFCTIKMWFHLQLELLVYNCALSSSDVISDSKTLENHLCHTASVMTRYLEYSDRTC